MASANSNPATITVQLIMDIDYVTEKNAPGTSPSAPTLISSLDYIMIAADSRGAVQGNGTTALTLPAEQKDNLRIFMAPAFPRILDSVIPYNIGHITGQNVIHTLQTTTMKYNGFEPDPTKDDGLPCLQVVQTVNRLDAWINQPGPAGIYVDFVLYTLNAAGTQETLVGYYRCEPNITIVRP